MADRHLDARPGAAPLPGDAAGKLSRASAKPILRLLALYVAQGLPFGFATIFVPLQLAGRDDFSYAKTTLFSLANFPWVLKLLWAPAADAHYLPSLGQRRSWILPAQLCLAATAFGAADLDFAGPLLPIFAVTAILNLWASLQDTAVDGLAVETLGEAERGLGNAAQVAGFKAGMLLAGPGLVVVARWYGTTAALHALAASVLAVVLVPLFMREGAAKARAHDSPPTTRAALDVLRRVLRGRGWLATIAFIGTVKVAETMVSGLLKPWLVRERGYVDTEAALVVGVVGMAFSLAGSALGGYLAGRFGRIRMLRIFAVLQAVALIGLGASVMLGLDRGGLAVAIAAEHFFTGLLTPALFAYMMDVSEPSIGATHYTLLATVEVLTKGAAGAAAGALAQPMGVPLFMVAAGLVGAMPLLLLPLIRRPHEEGASALEGSARDLDARPSGDIR